jgi:hypothetical protein
LSIRLSLKLSHRKPHSDNVDQGWQRFGTLGALDTSIATENIIMKKLLLTLAVLAASVATPVLAYVQTPPGGSPVPDSGATALLAALSLGALALAKNAMKKR